MRLPKLNELYKTKFVQLIPLIVLINGCATIFGENDREISIASIPPGAEVYMDGVNYGKTPTSLVLPHVGYFEPVIVLNKPGYKSESFTVATEFQNVGYWNLIVLPAFLIDLGTGYMYKIKPGSYLFEIPLESVVHTSITTKSKVTQTNIDKLL